MLAFNSASSASIAASSSSSSSPSVECKVDMNSVLSSVYTEARKVHENVNVCDLSCYCGTYALSSKKFDGMREDATKLSEWVKANHPGAVAHYVVENKRKSNGATLHVNFANEADLSASMSGSV